MRTPWAIAWTAVRAATAVYIGAAVITQLSRSIASAQEHGWDITTVVTNFFSYFTILSNVVAAIVLAWAVVWFWMRGGTDASEPPALATALASATTYMIITGIVYNTLLRDLDVTSGTEVSPWTNVAMHVIGPIILAADLLVGPKRRALPWSSVWLVLAVPIVWVVYTMIRGPLIVTPATGTPYWYPYPFLNPHLQPDGYVGVLGWVLIISAMFVAVGFLVVWIGRRRGTVARPVTPELDA